MPRLRVEYGERIGQEVHNWTIIKLNMRSDSGGQRTVLCKCKCGTERIIPLTRLFHDKTKHCGCLNQEITSKRHDREATPMIGVRFGRLVVLERADNPGTRPNRYWKCQCDCGNITESTTSKLKKGHTTSCGCARKKSAFTSDIDGMPIVVSRTGTTTPFSNGIYLWYDENDCIVYVGKYTSGSRDSNQKTTNRPWNHIPDRIVISKINVIECTKAQVDVLEQHFIMALQPKLNKQLNFSKIKIRELKPIKK